MTGMKPSHLACYRRKHTLNAKSKNSMCLFHFETMKPYEVYNAKVIHSHVPKVSNTYCSSKPYSSSACGSRIKISSDLVVN